ncbi:hypothetical protein [Haloarcula sp. CGMCC 1.2071]|uniref:hypothetical protein n=1 Tax=Haloarcula sp. CGMCC 1.2071 TaxID=3111454 RepID=UPI00300EC3D8
MADISDYEDAVRRIVEADVPDDAVTKADVERALIEANIPQYTSDVIEGMTDAVVTVDRVVEAIQSTGKVPSSSQVDALTDISDDYDMDDRVAEVSSQVREQVATEEDIESAIRERREQARESNRPTFKQDVEGAVSEVSESKQLVGQSADEVTSEQAREIGAPDETSFRREATQTVAQAEQVNPSEVIDGTSAKTPVQVIEDSSGDVIAATGGPSEDIGSQVADELGAEYLSTEQVVEEMSTAGTGETVDVTLRGRTVGEVDVE